jgi:hypothetical protein
MEEIERWAFRNTWSRSSIKQTGSKSQAILATGIVRSAGWRGSMEETNKAGRIDPSKGSYFVTNWSYRGFYGRRNPTTTSSPNPELEFADGLVAERRTRGLDLRTFWESLAGIHVGTS